jgi:hypothetical protein
MIELLHPPQIQCLVFTYRDGVLSRVGHDLKLRVNDWQLEMNGNEITATFFSESLKVVSAWKDGRENRRALSRGDVRSIEDNIRKDVLKTGRFPEITFTGTVQPEGDEAVHVAGDLEIMNRTRPLALDARLQDGVWVAETQIDQRDFGIKPFKAFLGALRIVPELDVEIRIENPTRD